MRESFKIKKAPGLESIRAGEDEVVGGFSSVIERALQQEGGKTEHGLEQLEMVSEEARGLDGVMTRIGGSKWARVLTGGLLLLSLMAAVPRESFAAEKTKTPFLEKTEKLGRNPIWFNLPIYIWAGNEIADSIKGVQKKKEEQERLTREETAGSEGSLGQIKDKISSIAEEVRLLQEKVKAQHVLIKEARKKRGRFEKLAGKTTEAERELWKIEGGLRIAQEKKKQYEKYLQERLSKPEQVR